MIPVGGWPQPDAITTSVTRCANFFADIPRALEHAAIRRNSIFYRIGNCDNLVLRDSEIWQFAFPTFVASNNCAGDRFKEAGT